MPKINKENILETSYQYIAHQTNCVSTNYAGLAKFLFDKYPFAKTSAQRTNQAKLGDIDICSDGINNRYIINMYAQYYPGESKYSNGIDTNVLRQEAFNHCLDEISLIKNLKEIAFPYFIGCGLAGGNFELYNSYIENFEKKLPNVQVFYCKI